MYELWIHVFVCLLFVRPSHSAWDRGMDLYRHQTTARYDPSIEQLTPLNEATSRTMQSPS